MSNMPLGVTVSYDNCSVLPSQLTGKSNLSGGWWELILHSLGWVGGENRHLLAHSCSLGENIAIRTINGGYAHSLRKLDSVTVASLCRRLHLQRGGASHHDHHGLTWVDKFADGLSSTQLSIEGGGVGATPEWSLEWPHPHPWVLQKRGWKEMGITRTPFHTTHQGELYYKSTSGTTIVFFLV